MKFFLFILRLLSSSYYSRVPRTSLKPTQQEDGSDVMQETTAEVVDTSELVTPEPEIIAEIDTKVGHQKRYTWCINAGHGSLQAGKRSPIIPEFGHRLMEWHWNRQIKIMIFRELDRLGVDYFDVVPEDHVGSFLSERVRRANNHASTLNKIYLSIHANAGPATDIDSWTKIGISGTETWHCHTSKKGRKAATIFQQKLVAATGFKNRNIKSKPSGQFYELVATNMVAILTESGFYNNKVEVMKLLDPQVMKRIALAHVSAIIEIETNGL